MDTPKITPKLFLAMYAVILLPLLVLNILVSQWNLDRVTDREEKQIQAKLDKISVELTELHATYNSKATQIYSKSALSYRNMVGNFATAQAGADLLKDLAILDDRTCDFYMYYHSDEMFAARGYSHTDVFFGSQLFASKDTFDSAMTAIDAESPVAFLVNRKDYTNSYMIYHYPVTFGDQAGITATGFVFTLNTVMESFPDVTDLPYILRISDAIAGASYRLAADPRAVRIRQKNQNRLAILQILQRIPRSHHGAALSLRGHRHRNPRKPILELRANLPRHSLFRHFGTDSVANQLEKIKGNGRFRER